MVKIIATNSGCYFKNRLANLWIDTVIIRGVEIRKDFVQQWIRMLFNKLCRSKVEGVNSQLLNPSVPDKTIKIIRKSGYRKDQAKPEEYTTQQQKSEIIWTAIFLKNIDNQK